MPRRHLAAIATSVLVLTGTATAVPLLVSGGVAGASTTTQFTTPGCSVYTVPPGRNLIQVDAFGAQGGSTSGSLGASGGLGGHAGGLINVSPGQGLDVCVGGQGSGTTPGINGGGAVLNTATMLPAGAPGRGASDVRTGAFGISERVLVAGGGGGAVSLNDIAGAGGGASGTDCVAHDPDCGAGGSQTAGGAAGAAPTGDGNCDVVGHVTSSHPGTLGVGGTGGDVFAGNVCVAPVGQTSTGGGGGGGYYGGGGGGGGSAGGGGSGFVAPSIQANGAWVNTGGVRSGNGEVDITPVGSFSILSTSVPPAARGGAYGPVTLQVANIGTSSSPYTTTLKWHKLWLPKGLTLSAAGVLSGTPSTKLPAFVYPVSVNVTETVTTLNGTKKVKTKTTVQATIPLTIN